MFKTENLCFYFSSTQKTDLELFLVFFEVETLYLTKMLITFFSHRRTFGFLFFGCWFCNKEKQLN